MGSHALNVPRSRSRLAIFFLLGIVIAVGIWSRVPNGRFPLPFKAVGDTLWATMFYLWALMLLPRLSMFVAAGVTLAITFSIEFLKLYHAPWIDAASEPTRIAPAFCSGIRSIGMIWPPTLSERCWRWPPMRACCGGEEGEFHLHRPLVRPEGPAVFQAML